MKHLFILFISLTICFSSAAQKNPFVPGDVIIQVFNNASVRDLVSKAPENFKVEIAKELSPTSHIWLLNFDPNVVSHQDMINWLYKQNEIELAQNNYYLKLRSTIPNDPTFTNQWHHRNTGQTGGTSDADIDSDLAWDITTGGTTASGHDIVVCLIESGNLDHQDLSPNRWVNTNEIDNNGVDDDGNGYVDDYNGWNPLQNNDNYGTGGHGTNCLGMIGAKGNNGTNVVGANWDVKLMVVGGYSINTDANAIQAYQYPYDMRVLWNNSGGSQGAFVVATSSSWGIDQEDPNNHPVWCNFYTTMGEAGILNVGATTNSNLNVDAVGDMPTACNTPYMIGVGRTDHNDNTAGGYGLTTIELGAPGINVVTTSGTSGTTTTTGTSFSCPLTAGVIGLAYSIPCPNFMSIVSSDPQGGADLVLQALLSGTDPKPQLASKFVSGGRLNSKNTLDDLMAIVCSGNLCLAPSAISSSNITASSADIQFTAYNSATSTTLYWRAVGASNWTVVSNASSTTSLSSLSGCSSYEYYLESVCGGDTSSQTSVQTFSTLGCGNCVDLAYCTSGTGNNEEWVETLAIGSYSFTTGDDGGYGDFTGNSTFEMDLTIDSTYSITVTPGWLATQYDEQSQIWIDLNQDGTFDANELVFAQAAPSQNPATGTITIPSTALPGSTRLRVSMAYIGGNNTLPSACDQFTYGEVEDYCVNIIQGTICGMNVSSTVSDPQCSGVDNGSISVNVTGGTAGYSYDWGSSFGNSSSISGLAPGNYSLTISDAAQCDTTVNYSLTYQTTLTVDLSANDISCNGASDGTIDAIASGGSNYTYNWGSGFGTVSSLTGLSAGNYSVTVVDGNGCTESASITINEPAPEQASFTFNPTYLVVDFTNSSSPGSYSWDFGDGNTSTLNSPSHTYSSAGNYTVCLNVTTACGTFSSCENITVQANTTGIETNESQFVGIYPNPSDYEVFFEINSAEASTIKLLDLNGKLVNEIYVTSSIETINVSQLSNGVYNCQIVNASGNVIQTSKITVAK